MKTFAAIQISGLMVIALASALASAQIIAHAEIIASNSKTTGYVFIIENVETVKIVGRLTGLEPEGKHGFHIHTSGNLSGNS
jgi:Cu/Zn superoxide dismutase